MQGETEVKRRTSILDSASALIGSPDDLVEDCTKVVRLMGDITNGYVAGTYGTPPMAEAHALDTLVNGCQLVRRISARAPSLISGPLERRSQLWTVAAQTHLAPRRRASAPVRERLGPIAPVESPQVKPTKVGFYTSSAIPGSHLSSWQIYLEHYGGTLFPKPWQTYRLPTIADARVAEVGSAQTWVELVARYPTRQGRAMYPDWHKLAQDYDAVHLSFAVIIAMQGIRLSVGESFIMESYWDVETTFWLNWGLDSGRSWPA